MSATGQFLSATNGQFPRPPTGSSRCPLTGDEDFGAGGIDGYFAKEVTEAARILSRLAWSPWLARIDLRWRLRNSASVPRSAMHQRYDALSAMLSTHTASYPVRLESLSPRPSPTSLTRF